jgi:hypothetical protein
MVNNVDFFRLITGEDIVSEYEDTEDCYRLINPCKIVYLSSVKKGHISISLMQWIFAKVCDNQVFDLPKSQVQVKSTVSESLIEHYHTSVDHFIQVEAESKIDLEEYEKDDSIENVSSDETLDLIKEYISNLAKQDKGKLH